MAKLSAEARFHILTQPNAEDAVSRLNRFLLDAGLSDRFITLAVAIIDPASHKVALINAGHVAPMVYRRATEVLTDAMDADHSGFPLGVDERAEYQTVEVSLDMGDALLIFTDGVTDALNPEGLQFRLDGVRRVLSNESAVVEPIAPGRVGKRVIDGVRAHIAGRDQYDDIALVSFGRWEGPPTSGRGSRV